MTEHKKQNVDASSVQFKKGVEAGLNSAKDTKDWKAGNELGQELKNEGDNKELGFVSPPKEFPTPLFVGRNPGGNQGNAQDEKDETVE